MTRWPLGQPFTVETCRRALALARHHSGADFVRLRQRLVRDVVSDEIIGSEISLVGLGALARCSECNQQS